MPSPASTSESRALGPPWGDALAAGVKAVHRSLTEQGAPAPEALLLLATGTSILDGELEQAEAWRLGECADCPEPWRGVLLRSGVREGIALWVLEDVGAEAAAADPTVPWWPAFPIWLAAKAGARLCVHVSAGAASRRAPRAGTGPSEGTQPHFLFASDHINLSGTNPLLGLGECALGPLFPDQSAVHHAPLRQAALARAHTLGLSASEGVVLCTQGPMLETPAERHMHETLGAAGSVQSLAAPLIAAAHAGLPVLSVTCLLASEEPAQAERADAPIDVSYLTARALEARPLTQRLLLALLTDVAATLRAEPPLAD